MLKLKKNAVLAEVARARRLRAPGETSSLALVRVGAEPVVLHAEEPTPAVQNLPEPPAPRPSWWPASFAWPPAISAPPNWLPGVKWPPTTSAELGAGIRASITGEPAKNGSPGLNLTPGQKDGVAIGIGGVLGWLVAKVAVGAGAATFGPLALGAALGAALGHVTYALATGNPITEVATRGCGCGGGSYAAPPPGGLPPAPPPAPEPPVLAASLPAEVPPAPAPARAVPGGYDVATGI